MSARSGTAAAARRQLASWPPAAQWATLLLLSVVISLTLSAVGLPAALLLGPMIGGILFGVNDLRLAVPRWPYLVAQGVVGALVSTGITPAIIVTLGHHWLLFGTVVAATLLGAAALGWLISRSGLIPGVTAVYGISPGAASAMVVQGEAHGADARLVALMQYSRVVLVALAAALVARLWGGTGGEHVSGAPWLAPVNWGSLVAMLVLAALGQQVARLLRLRAWGLLGPMLVLSALHAGGWLDIELPR